MAKRHPLQVDARVQRAADESHATDPPNRLPRRDAEFWHAVFSIEGFHVKPLPGMVADFEASGIVTELQECEA